MHISDAALECARECLRIASELPDGPQKQKLVHAGLKLINSLVEDATISVTETLADAIDLH